MKRNSEKYWRRAQIGGQNQIRAWVGEEELGFSLYRCLIFKFSRLKLLFFDNRLKSTFSLWFFSFTYSFFTCRESELIRLGFLKEEKSSFFFGSLIEEPGTGFVNWLRIVADWYQSGTTKILAYQNGTLYHILDIKKKH